MGRIVLGRGRKKFPTDGGVKAHNNHRRIFTSKSSVGSRLRLTN